MAAVTFVVGEVMALLQQDIKRMLAYSTLAQIGEIGMVLSLGTYAATAGAFENGRRPSPRKMGPRRWKSWSGRAASIWCYWM